MFTNHSGGCPGSDIMWENEGLKYGVYTIAYSFWNHRQNGRNQKILSGCELKEGFEAVMKANKALKKYPQGQHQYIQNLLSRNWFQVKNSEAVFAVGMLQDEKTVKGGTGWAIQMSVDNKKSTFVFDQNFNRWYKFNYVFGRFEIFDGIPTLTENFAGIGTREINENGINAIKKIYKKNFCN
jgi:hypothetical protein